MGKLDDMKDKAGDLASEHGDKVKEGMEKAGDFVDEKTGGKHSDKIDKGVEKGQDLVDDMGGEGDTP
jgi:antitoxin protein of toxin-antitoxin system